ncbi:MAG: biotin--[acetyl-CoA-carboxylase] ligase [Actinomycetota bacterium]
MATPGLSPRWSVEVVDEIGSTNDELLGRLAHGRASDGDVLVARHQVAGRGRLDRSWASPPGRNLLMSIVIDRPAVDPALATRALGVASLLAARAIVDDPSEIELKWPNDLLRGGHKLSGVLAQLTGDGIVVAGIGVNVTWAPPEGAALAPDVDAAAGDRVDDLVGRVRDRILTSLGEFLDAPSPATTVDEAYRANLGTIGRRVRVELADRSPLIGDAVDVDQGRLVVAVDGERHRVDVGDVVHLRSLDPGDTG